jgi:hypothetical protein
MDSVFALYDAAVSALSALGLGYLLYSRRFAVAYPRFFRTLALGLLAFAVVSVGVALHPAASPVEALAGPFVLPALYLLVRRQLLAARDDGRFGALDQRISGRGDERDQTRTGDGSGAGTAHTENS